MRRLSSIREFPAFLHPDVRQTNSTNTSIFEQDIFRIHDPGRREHGVVHSFPLNNREVASLRDMCVCRLRWRFRDSSPTDIEDAVGDAIALMLSDAPPHVAQSTKACAAWVRTVSERLLAHTIKRQLRQISLDDVFATEVGLSSLPVCDMLSVEQDIDAELLLRLLSSKDRMILQLTLTDFPMEQLAEMFGCSIEALKKRNERSIRKLQRICGVAPPPVAGSRPAKQDWRVTNDNRENQIILTSENIFRSSVSQTGGRNTLIHMGQLPHTTRGLPGAT
jgi:RNA polymerase sigma factor (sigma-70 family)